VFTSYFTFKGPAFAQVSNLPCSILGKLHVLISSCLDFAVHKTFQVKCWLKSHVVISGSVLRALKVLNLRSNYICTWTFPSVGSGVLRTWKDAGPLQVKFLVIAEKFKCNLQSDPEIFYFFWSASNPRESFWTINSNIGVNSCETVPLKGQ